MRCRAFVLLLLLAAVPARARADEPWERVLQEDGITVTKRDVPARGFPTFRAVGMIQAPLFDVLAIIGDVPRYPDWQVNCMAARQLKKINELEYLVYSRVHAPWPVADRDAVYHSNIHVDVRGNLVVDVRFRGVKSELAPPVKGVVRMEKIRGHFKLTAVAPDKTLMDYQVDADPGGAIPAWLAKWTSRRLPLDTIKTMRARVKKTRGSYAERIKHFQEMERELREAQASKR
ncbi:MAG TPA: START domain-containing protein [Polyangia bacterium]|jgi:hypothetical protein